MSAQWVWVQREVSDSTRVCAYDRAGMGWSETGPQPRDAKQISSELHTLLTKADIEGPYVLVGHSFGGLYLQTYAARYSEEVAGVALVESSHPDQFSYRQVARDSYEPQKQIFDVFSLAARLGIIRLVSKLAPTSPELPPQQRAQIDALTPLDATSEYVRTRVSGHPSNRHPNAQPEKPGNKALAVVTAGTQEPSWLKLQDDLATLSPNSTHRVVKGATHTSVMYDRSDAQVTSAAIVDVVQAVRKDQPVAR